ncbi:hypothetical protein [Dactylosporangium sp. NPDC049140]|uniref:hypothetical protein n=1 Tax=Dactylosporangium sp. NPDC049140 TaxID=3155647 RepID=UPI00340E4834
MRAQGIVAAVLAAVVLACAGLTGFVAQLRRQNLRAIGEVTEVVEGARPGTVLVRTERAGYEAAWWVVDDTGAATDTADAQQIHSGPVEQGCAARACYRVRRGELRVQRSDDGGSGEYTTVWEVRGAAYDALAAAYPGLGDPAEHLASRSIVVHAVAGGHVVFVADGRDGLLYRDAADAWHRLGAPDSGEGCCFYQPVPRLSTDPAPFDPVWPAAALAGVAVLVTGLLRRPRSVSGVGTVLILTAAAGYGAALAARMPGAGMFPGPVCGAPLGLVIVAAGCALAWRLPPRLRAAS